MAMLESQEPNLQPDPPTQLSWRVRFKDRRRLTPFLITFFLIIAMSEVFMTLVAQSRLYYEDYSVGFALMPPTTTLIQGSPLLFLIVGTAYAFLMVALLRWLPRKLAFLVWLVVGFLHISNIVLLGRCTFETHLPFSQFACENVALSLRIGLTLVFGIVISLSIEELSDTSSTLTRQRLQHLAKGGVRIVAAGWLVLLSASIVAIMLRPFSGWVAIFPSTMPPERISAAIAYDVQNGQAIMFGGESATQQAFNDTWVWDGLDWHEMNPATVPPARSNASMAYDPERGVTVMFGGRTQYGDLGDTWEWDGENWSFIEVANFPPAACCPRMYFEPSLDRIVLASLPKELTNDHVMWIYEETTWIEVESAPTEMSWMPELVTYDNVNQRSLTLTREGLWQWSNDSLRWESKLTMLRPPHRIASAMAYDIQNESIVMYGGYDETSSQVIGDTWLFRDNRWTELAGIPAAGSRWGHVMFYDERRNSVLLLGGFDGSIVRTCMWELVLNE